MSSEHQSKTISIDQFAKLLLGGPGLILGPLQSLSSGSYLELQNHIVDQCGGTGQSFFELGSKAISAGKSEEEIRKLAHDFIAKQQRNPSINAIAKTRWNAVVSFCIDTNFETKFRSEMDRPSRNRTVIVLDDFSRPIPPRGIPVFKALGSLYREDFPVTTAGFVRQRSQWRRIVPCFAEHVRASPVVCLGMLGLEEILLDFFGEMLADRSTAPSHVIFLADDPLSNNRSIAELLRGRTNMATVNGSLSDVLKEVSAASQSGYGAMLQFNDDATDPLVVFSSHEDVVCTVNRQIMSTCGADDRLLLLDLLFAPNSARWDPFVFGYDFPRERNRQLLERIKSTATDSGDCLCVLHGSAATGKTTLLKRIALDLVKNNWLVFWQRTSFLPDPSRQLRALFEDIKKLARERFSGLVFFIDDPTSAGNYTAELVMAAANAAQIRITIVVGIRTIEWLTTKNNGDYLSKSTIIEELHDQFTDSEWLDLPLYLSKIGAFSSKEEAQSKMRSNGNSRATARDILSMLYYLLPQTRGSISSSVRSEYFRLGDMSGLRSIVIGAQQHTTEMLRDAYEMVAASDLYRTPLPVEVLVSALGVDYGPWIDASKPGGPAWGILYYDDTLDGSTYYRTRNAVITDLLIQTINGSLSNRSGEVRLLLKLLRACKDRTGPIYREYCVRLLVPITRLDRLDYLDGLSLFDAAIDSLPFQDRTLLHHKALWIKNKGRDSVLAESVLKEALRAPSYPYTEREELSEHIQTSLAATILDSIDAGKTSLEEGSQRVFDCLAKARNGSSVNAKAVHVNANLAIRHVLQLKDSPGIDKFLAACGAVSEVDRALMVLENPAGSNRSNFDDVRALNEVRDKLFMSISDIESLEAAAEESFARYRTQEGYVLAAQKYLGLAKTANKGTQYKKGFDYCVRIRNKVGEQGLAVSSRLAEIQLQIYYQWMIVRLQSSSFANSRIDWVLVEQMCREVLQDSEIARAPIYKYIFAVAIAHQGHWDKANQVFTQLRQFGISSEMLWKPRGLIQNDDGGPRQFQGVVRQGADRKLIKIEEISQEFYCDRQSAWVRDNELTHCYLQLAFGGATALSEMPTYP